MMLAKVASNMTTIRHCSSSYPLYSSIYNSISEQQNPDRDESKVADFSEFKDPWENYVDKRNISFESNLRQTDEHRHVTASSSYVEPPRLIEHNQCGAEPPPFTLPCDQNGDQQNHHSLQFYETLQASQQENFSFENEANREFLEHHHASQMLVNQQQHSADEIELQSLTRDINQLAAFCNFIEQFQEYEEDHAHDTHYQSHHVDNRDLHHESLDSENKQTSLTFISSNSQDNRQAVHSCDNKPTDLHKTTSSHSQNPLPCTLPNNIMAQSELTTTPCIENAEGGLAGALSKLTLGESRTDEQRAIEDHIRKQNWEQGNVDFMGRDSFDNILKKINETLSSAPVKQPPAVQETRQPKKSSSKSSEVEAAVEESEVALPVLALEDQAESNTTHNSSEDTCQRMSSSGDVSFSNNDNEQLSQTQTLSNLASNETTNLSQELTVISTEGRVESATSDIVLKSQEETENKETNIILASESVTVSEKETEVNISASQIAPELLPSSVPPSTEISTPIQSAAQIISEAVTEYPVPIQVAESVLQAEPKESVAEDPRPVIEAVVSSIIPPVQESAATISETLIEPGQNENLQCQLNGNDPSLQFKENTMSPLKSDTAITQFDVAPLSLQSESTVPIESDGSAPVENQLAAQLEVKSTSLLQTETIQVEPETVVEGSTQPIAQIEAQTKIQDELQCTSATKSQSTNEVEPQIVEDPEGPSQKSKLTVMLPTAEESKDEKSESTNSAQSQQELKGTDSEDASVKPVEESPVRPNRSKELKIPGTPTVIEATPPTSPPLDVESIQTKEEDVKEQREPTEIKDVQKVEETCSESVSSIEKESATKEVVESEPAVKDTVKKIEKKSSAESDSPSTPEAEGSTKKVVKKVVKKVSKKAKEGEEDSGSAEKLTKKIVKKVSKSSSSLDTDKSVPETPPPSTGAEPPVPPKRKVKSTASTKPAGKKPDES